MNYSLLKKCLVSHCKIFSFLVKYWYKLFCLIHVIYGYIYFVLDMVFFSFILSLISTVWELFFTKEVPCFTLQDIFISGEVLVLAFLSHLSNLWLDIFCSRYGFFSFVLSLISTVCELFFTKEVPYFTLQDIFISGEVLVLAFLSHLSNLWLDIFCSRYGFFSFVLSLISTVWELFFTK